MGSFTLSSNAQQIAASLNEFMAGLPILAGEVSRQSAEIVAAKAREFAHIGKDPTYPRGRPHTRDTIFVHPVSQQTSLIVAEWGAFWEEQRGGEHAFLTNAIAATQADVQIGGESLLADAVARIHV